MTLLFTPGTRYLAQYETYLPSLKDTKQHFLEFIRECSIPPFPSGRLTDPRGQYPPGRLDAYYRHLVKACRRKYRFWLTDIRPSRRSGIPDRPTLFNHD
jgi:hypothetical protein